MMRKQLKVELGATDALPQVTGSARLIQRLFKALIDRKNLAVDVVVTTAGAHRITGDDHAFNHRMRVEPEQIAILECPRLAFVRIAHDIFIAGERARHEAPLEAGRETRTATSAQHGFLDFADQVILRNFFSQNALELGITATRFIILQPPASIAPGPTCRQHRIDCLDQRHLICTPPAGNRFVPAT